MFWHSPPETLIWRRSLNLRVKNKRSADHTSLKPDLTESLPEDPMNTRLLFKTFDDRFRN